MATPWTRLRNLVRVEEDPEKGRKGSNVAALRERLLQALASADRGRARDKHDTRASEGQDESSDHFEAKWREELDKALTNRRPVREMVQSFAALAPECAQMDPVEASR